jgi:hypothetical protein
MKGLVRHLVETGQSGSIVNILSMVADCAQSYLTPYSASKGALETPPRDDVQLAMIQIHILEPARAPTPADVSDEYEHAMRSFPVR